MRIGNEWIGRDVRLFLFKSQKWISYTWKIHFYQHVFDVFDIIKNSFRDGCDRVMTHSKKKKKARTKSLTIKELYR